MQIAVTSQNRRTITQHAGKCRAFMIYAVEEGEVRARNLVELPMGASFHDSHEGLPQALCGVDVLITGSMGAGLSRRLAQHGIRALITEEEDPDTAVADFVAGRLQAIPNNHRHQCEHHPD